ncbi:DUF5067 domain-containing protein [Klugiella xanthotipulae]
MPVSPQGGPAGKNTLGLVAIIVAGVGFVAACIPFVAYLSWFLLVPGLVLAIIALVQKNKKKGLAIAALITSVLGIIMSIIIAIVSIVILGAGVSSAIEDAGGSSLSQQESGKEFSLGDTATMSDGVAFTVTDTECGITSATDMFDMEQPAQGEFCTVEFTVKNGSNDSVSLATSVIAGMVGSTEYYPDGLISTFGTDSMLTTLNPGLSVDSVMYFDVPAGSTLDSVRLNTNLGLGTGVTFSLK